MPWKFQTTPRNFWNDISNQRKYIDWLAKELKITKQEDWYSVNQQVIH